jgi:hypothetical protein
MPDNQIYEVSYTVELSGDIKVQAENEDQAVEAVADGSREVNRLATRKANGVGFPEVTEVPYVYSADDVTPDVELTE